MKKILNIFLCTFLFLSCESTDNKNLGDSLQTVPADEIIIDTPEEIIHLPVTPTLPEENQTPIDIVDSEVVPEIVLTDEMTDGTPDEIGIIDILPNTSAVLEETEDPIDIVDSEVVPEIVLTDEMTDDTPDEIVITDIFPNISALPEEIEEPIDIVDIEVVPEIVLTDEMTDDTPDEIIITDIFPNISALPEETEDSIDSEVVPEIVLTDEMTDGTPDEIGITDILPNTSAQLEENQVPTAILDTEVPPESPLLAENLETAQVSETSQGNSVLPLESGIADILPDSGVVPQDFEQQIESEPIVPGQSLEVNEGQYIDILFPGQGWIYLGAVTATDPVIVSFSNRQTEGVDTLFVLQGKNTGLVILHFYKQDVLENIYIDEYIEVSVIPRSNSSPSSLSVLAGGLEESMIGISSEPEVSLAQGLISDVAEDENITLNQDDAFFDDFLVQAQIAYNEQRYADSLILLNDHVSQSSNQLDRAWFLYGQIYESNSDQRNIRKALDAYETLVASFPSSNLWDEAKKRITYIERFYFNIR